MSIRNLGCKTIIISSVSFMCFSFFAFILNFLINTCE